MIKEKEIAEYKVYTGEVQEYLDKLVINNDNDYEAAIRYGKSVKKRGKEITASKEKITKPMNEALKEARGLFKPFEVACDGALTTIKGKMSEYKEKQAKKQDLEKERIEKRLEKGTMRQDTAVRKMTEMEEIKKTVETDEGSATIAKVKKYRVVDITKVPHEYLEVNMTAVRKAFKEAPVPGVEEYLENNVRL